MGLKKWLHDYQEITTFNKWSLNFYCLQKSLLNIYYCSGGKNGRISEIQNEMNLQTVTSDMPHITFMYVRQNCATVKSLNNL